MSDKPQFIKKNGKIIPIGPRKSKDGKKSKLKTKIKKQEKAVSNRKKKVNSSRILGNALGGLGLLAGAAIGKTLVEKSVGAAVLGGLGLLGGKQSESKQNRRLKTNKYRLNKSKDKLRKMENTSV